MGSCELAVRACLFCGYYGCCSVQLVWFWVVGLVVIFGLTEFCGLNLRVCAGLVWLLCVCVVDVVVLMAGDFGYFGFGCFFV